MPYKPTSTVTISKEDGKLVIVRKPVLRTRRETFFGCFWPILIFVAIMVFSLTMSFFHILRNSGKEEADAFLLIISVVIFAILVGIIVLVIFDKQRKHNFVHPPDYDDEVLTFDTDKFMVKYHGMVSVFSYRRDARPVLRHCCYLPESAEVSIPCHPLGDHVSDDFHWGYYDMAYVDRTNAERILAAMKEHFEMIQAVS